eukprot:CAMPEP_0201476760 /NCGR_PEP_ID=MMETSP0151_2-20130828/1901_1 /ASSEMBLY_ACC=CAM_ASM_000257 /TAXON_ID=200890 /ORGANISM="Paramoeba atlantica, Strain 621/1 / CCAP 1560/9" /LENGTH=279 /DNA_ID=CAMNT_0047857237 /DNA_START=113 /DNA_END=952 /DNA_ORIENTATION=+
MDSSLGCVVTGGSHGIGRETVLLFCSLGHRVVIADLDLEIGKTLATEINTKYGEERAVAIECNVLKVNDLRKAIVLCIHKFACFDIMVNNAGIGEESCVWYGTYEDKEQERLMDMFAKVIDIDFTALVKSTFLSLQAMREQGTQNGVIVNIASMGGILPMVGSAVYAGAKAGVINFSRSFVSNGPSDPLVVAVCPSLTDTRLMRGMSDADSGASNELKDSIGGLLTPQEIAEGIRLAVENARKTGKTGSVLRITVRGGYDYWNPPRKAIPVKPIHRPKL